MEEVSLANGDVVSMAVFVKPTKVKSIHQPPGDFAIKPPVSVTEASHYDDADPRSLYFIFGFSEELKAAQFELHCPSSGKPFLAYKVGKPVDPAFDSPLSLTPDRKQHVTGVASDLVAASSELIDIVRKSASSAAPVGGKPDGAEEEEEDGGHV